jgi:hypothetical protein
MKNPFRYGQVVSAKDFCPRPELLGQLTSFIQSSQNVVLAGERRMGKTSLIYEAVRKLKYYRSLYIDLLEIRTNEDLCKRMVTAIISMERQSGLLEKILKGLSQLRPVVAFDPVTGQPTVSIDAGIKLRPDSTDGLLDLIADVAKRKPLVVVFDEFQDILNLSNHSETLAALRSKIQFHSGIPYVFAGSVRKQMSVIFTDPESAFFKSATVMEVGPLITNVFARFLSKKFASGKRNIEVEVLLKLMELADHVPGDVQELCSCLWENTAPGDDITNKAIGPALELIFARESKGYEAVLVQLTGQQLKCLTGLARVGGKAPLSAAFLRETGIGSPASVQKALNRLLKSKVIYRHEGEYKFVNPFLKSWLVWKNY